MIQPQIRAGKEKQIIEPVTTTGKQLKMQSINTTSVDIHHREQCTVDQWSDDKPHFTSDSNKSVDQTLEAYGTDMIDQWCARRRRHMRLTSVNLQCIQC
jgi:hypothetical protein